MSDEIAKIIPKNKFYSPQEIADLELEGFVASVRGVRDVIERENWQDAGLEMARPRAAKGGGWEYSPSLFPETAQIDYMRRYYAQILEHNEDFLEAVKAQQAQEKKVIIHDSSRILNDRQLDERDAKLEILRHWERFRGQYDGSKAKADLEFIMMYNSGQSSFECVQQACIKSISKPSLKRWLKDRNSHKIGRLASRGGGRKGTGFFETALGGEIKTYIGALYLHQPQITLKKIRRLVAIKFGREIEYRGRVVPLPHLRTLERWWIGFMDEHKNAFMMVIDPDGYKNKVLMVGNNMNSHVKYFNQKWELDASPTDILTTDGRYTLYALIDVFTRQTIIYISKTPTTEAVLALMRMAIKIWGIPDEVATDNGSDFTSKRFVKALKDLGIYHHLCDPYSPEQKGTVERVIGTINHDLMSMIPGFVGHSVADRKKIEARSSFANRLGAKDDAVFCIETSPEKLQDYCNVWAEFEYGRNEHGALDGMSPYEKQQTCTRPLKKIKDMPALDLLFAPIASGDGTRIVTKQGVRIDKEYYWSAEVEVGARVFVIHAPDDLGIVYLFSEDGLEFICKAECPALSKIDPKAMIKAKRRSQKEQHKRLLGDMKAQTRKMKPSDLVDGILEDAVEHADNVTRLPKAEVDYTTDALEMAGDALAGYELVKEHKVEAEIITLPTAKAEPEHLKRERLFKKCNDILARIEAGEAVSAADVRWSNNYVSHVNYLSEKMLEDINNGSIDR